MIAALAAAAALACPVEAPDASGLRQAETRWVAALERRDGPALACRLASEFIDQDWRGGTRTRATMLSALPDRPPSWLRLSEVTARTIGTVGIARGVDTQTAPDGAAVGTVRFTDIFVYRDRRWQAIAAQETLIAAPR